LFFFKLTTLIILTVHYKYFIIIDYIAKECIVGKKCGLSIKEQYPDRDRLKKLKI